MTNRLDKLRTALEKHNLDAVALVPGANIAYMTGLNFHLMERPIIMLLHQQGAPAVVLPALESNKFTTSSPFDVNTFTYADGEDPADAVREAVQSLPEIQRLGVEQTRMRVLELRLLQHKMPVAYILDGQPALDELRLYKSDDEANAMREAIRISEAALEEVLVAARDGMTEKELAMRLSLAQSRLGGGHMPFEPVVLFGERAALPHGTPSERQLKQGDLILVDFGTTHEGYISDITRCFHWGEIDERTQQVYDVVKQANAAAREKAGPGVPCEAVDQAARTVIDEAGYGEYFIHRTGHGIGLDGHEAPYIVKGNAQALQPGMTFTIEPGIYIPGEIGVRIEDNMLVTQDGVESLTSYSRELQNIG